MSRIIKEFGKLYGPLVLGILVVSIWFLHSQNQNHKNIVSERQGAMVAVVSQIVTRDLASRAMDAQFLARLVSRRLSSGQDSSLRDLEDVFTDFARSRQSYFILRYLDQNGMERVRVDRSFAGLVLSPASSLQDKRGRYYFKKTLRAGKNDVYVSNFDLNIEHGRIDVPYRPTLRFGCPVIDDAGRKRGAIVLNLDGSVLLDEIRVQAGAGEGVSMLCNGDGYWMLGPSVQDEWGHIVGDANNASMVNRFASAWKFTSGHETGQIITDQGLFTFNTLNVVPDMVMSDDPPSGDLAQRRWKIMTWVPPALLHVSWMALYLSLTVLILVVLGAGCWFLAAYRVSQSEVEAQLRENEERTLAISQSSQDAIIMIDDQDRITHWNPAAERLFGYTAEEIMGQRFQNLLALESLGESANEVVKRFASTGMENGNGQVIEFDGLRKDGSLVPLELALSSFQFKGQRCAVGSLRDITRRKHSESELKRSEETGRALLNAPTESAMLIDPDGAIVAINEIGARRLGGSVDETIGRNAYDLIAPEQVENRRPVFLQVMETGEPAQFEDFRADRRMQINAYPVKAPDGSVERLAIFARDVTEQRAAETALMQSEQRFRDVSASVGEFIWETNRASEVTFITEDVIFVLGYAASELQGSMLLLLMPEEDMDEFKGWQNGVYDRREAFSKKEIRIVSKVGEILWLQIGGVPYYGDDGEFMGYRGAAMNITNRKAADLAIKTSERKLRALAESAYDGVIMIDINGHISFWNHAAEQLFGYTEEEALGSNVHSLVAPEEDYAKAEAGMFQFAMTGSGAAVGVVQEAMGKHKDGTLFPVERSVAGFRLGEEWYAVATIRDITERKATEAKLRELATTDGLTGLNNRRRFMELSEREFARSLRYDRPLALFMLDIDFFKKVNDTYGHSVGDDVLRSLSETAIMALRGADILGRIGGEEFGVLLPETTLEAAMEVAERLRVSIERSSLDVNGESLSVTVSIGVSIMKPDIVSIEALLKRADDALYDAKQSGRNRVVMS